MNDAVDPIKKRMVARVQGVIKDIDGISAEITVLEVQRKSTTDQIKALSKHKGNLEKLLAATKKDNNL